METGIQVVTMWTDTLLTNLGINQMVHSLIIDGVFAGVGSVLSLFADHRGAVFLPIAFWRTAGIWRA